MIHTFYPDKIDDLLKQLSDDDYVQMQAQDFLMLIEKARHNRNISNVGRKPIKPDEVAFRSVVARWQDGEITARAAMKELDLKPNTFYRRVKEMNDMTDLKKEIKEAIKEEKKELDELKAQVKAEARETKAYLKEEARAVKAQLKEEAKETISARKMEKEILKERLEAEAEHFKEVKEIEKEVRAEVKEFKDNN